MAIKIQTWMYEEVLTYPYPYLPASLDDLC